MAMTETCRKNMLFTFLSGRSEYRLHRRSTSLHLALLSVGFAFLFPTCVVFGRRNMAAPSNEVQIRPVKKPTGK